MRVTLLSKALVVGAYQRKCELIAAHPDVELTVLVPPAWGTQRLECAHMQGYDLRIIPIRLNSNFHLHHYPTLAAELQRSQPDVLHIDEEPYNLATWDAVRCAMRPRTASLVTRTLFFSWQNIHRTYPPPFSWMERDVLRKADAAIVGNREAEQVWRAKGFTRAIHVIPQFGVDEHAFTPAPHDLPEGGPDPALGHLPSPPRGATTRFTLGYAGRLEHAKGVDLLIRAFAQLSPQTRLVIAGTGEAESALRSLAAQLGIADHIDWRGAISSTQMPTFYRSLDTLALPSRTRPNWKEQFGRVLIEAMACGIPVVGARSGEIPNVIGEAGLLFDEGDVDSLATCLRRLFEQPALRDDLIQRGRARVLDHFTMTRIADQTVDVYRGLSCK